MRYLFILLFLTGCLTESVPKITEAPQHNLNGQWCANGANTSLWTYYQTGNKIYGKQTLSFQNWDSCIVYGTIENDSLKLYMYTFRGGSKRADTDIILGLIQKNDSLVEGVFFEEQFPNHTNTYHLVKF